MTPATGTWPGFVARVATPATPEQIAEQLAEGYEATIGGEVSSGELEAVLAQGLLETGTRVDPNHDGVTTAEEQAPGYWNGNLGNIRGTYGAPGWWTSFRAGEGHGAGQIILEPGPMNRFRSYLGPDESTDDDILRRVRRRGVDDLWRLLSRDRYAPALVAARAGDFHGYVVALHNGGYFTADVTAYGNAEDRLRRTIENLPLVAAYVRGIRA